MKNKHKVLEKHEDGFNITCPTGSFSTAMWTKKGWPKNICPCCKLEVFENKKRKK